SEVSKVGRLAQERYEFEAKTLLAACAASESSSSPAQPYVDVAGDLARVASTPGNVAVCGALLDLRRVVVKTWLAERQDRWVEEFEDRTMSRLRKQLAPWAIGTLGLSILFATQGVIKVQGFELDTNKLIRDEQTRLAESAKSAKDLQDRLEAHQKSMDDGLKAAEARVAALDTTLKGAVQASAEKIVQDRVGIAVTAVFEKVEPEVKKEAERQAASALIKQGALEEKLNSQQITLNTVKETLDKAAQSQRELASFPGQIATERAALEKVQREVGVVQGKQTTSWLIDWFGNHRLVFWAWFIGVPLLALVGLVISIIAVRRKQAPATGAARSA